MSPKRIFISSTCLDLIDVRAELKRSLEDLGYIVYTSETYDFPVNTILAPADNCLEVLQGCDIYVLIIHTRYGSRFDGQIHIADVPNNLPGGFLSATFAEYLMAKAAGLEVRIWVRDFIWNNNPRFRVDPHTGADGTTLPRGVEPTVYDFINHVLDNPQGGGSWINQFHDITDLKASIIHWLLQQAYINEEQFKHAVSELFGLQGYRFSPGELLQPGSQRALARLPDDRFGDEYAIWVFHHPAGRPASWNDLSQTILRITEDLRKQRYDRAFLAVSAGYQPDVLDMVRDLGFRRQLIVQSYEDMLGDLINFTPYMERVVYDYEHFVDYAEPGPGRDPIIAIMRRCNLYKYYVPLRAKSTPQSKKSFDGWLEDYVSTWLGDNGRNHLTILGDFGTGKSSFALWLTYTLARKAIGEGILGSRIPLFISLRDHVGKVDVREIVTNTLINTYAIRRADFQSFEKLLEAGRLLVILDGFDETATLTERATTLRILRNLNTLVRRNSKVILTCRSHYFRTHEEAERALRRSLEAGETELFTEQKGRSNYDIIYLHEFKRDQIEEFLKKHYDGDEGRTRETLRRISSTYNLRDLSRRPVMLEMILKVWPRLVIRTQAEDISPAVLYTEYVEEWITHVAKGNEELLDPATKRRFCEDLAKWMYRENRELLPYTELERLVRDYFKDRPPAAYAALDTEVRTCTFLNRDSVGNYQFAHRSFMEFLVARACALELSTGEYDLLKLRPLTAEIRNFLRGLASDREACWRVVRWTQDKGVTAAAFAGGNAVTLLRLMGESFKDLDLDRSVLLGADLTNTDFTGARFIGAVLRGATLVNCSFANADFREADLSDVRIGEMGAVSCLAWSADGLYLAVGGYDYNVRLWNTSTWDQLGILRGHDSSVLDVSFGTSGNLLYSSASQVIVWNIRGLNAIAEIRPELGNEVNGWVITGSGAFVQLQPPEGMDVITLSMFRAQAFYSTNGRYTVGILDGRRIQVRDWDVGGNPSFCSPPHDGEITCACYSPDDSAIAVGTRDGKVYVWDPFTGDCIAVLTEKAGSCRGMKLTGAKGLDAGDYWIKVENPKDPSERRKGTLGEWLKERGASEELYPHVRHRPRNSGEFGSRL